MLFSVSERYLLLSRKHVGCQQSDFKTKKMLISLGASLPESERIMCLDNSGGKLLHKRLEGKGSLAELTRIAVTLDEANGI